MMSEPEQKCENNAILKQKYTLKLITAFKMAYSWCFSLGGNLDFLDFLQMFYYISTIHVFFWYKFAILFTASFAVRSRYTIFWTEKTWLFAASLKSINYFQHEKKRNLC